MITAEQILELDDIQTIDVPVPEWKMTIRIKQMSGVERDAFERKQYELSKIGELGVNMRASMVAACAVNENGELLFNEDQVSRLGKKSSIALERLAKAAGKLNALTDVNVEDVSKNSSPSPAEGST